MKYRYCILFLLFTSLLKAQINLVPNPSFEEHVNCPVTIGVPLSPDIFSTVTHWYSPSDASPDYFHACSPPNSYSPARLNVPENAFGYQWPRTGQAYMGIMAFVTLKDGPVLYREYIAVKLTKPLIKNFIYQAQLFVSSAELPNHLGNGTGDISRIGLHFSSLPLRDFPTSGEISLIPQVANPATNFLTDQQNWMPIKGTYRAKGGERWIIIGNLYPDSSTQYKLRPTSIYGTMHSYYYIDDVSVELARTNNSLIDTSICSQGNIVFPATPYSDSCVWNDGQTALQRTFTGSGKWWVTYYNIDGLYSATDTLNLVVVPGGTKKDTVMCPGWTMLLKADSASGYLWNNGSNAPELAVFTPGTYWVRRTLNNCFTIDTFVIKQVDCSRLPPGGYTDTAVCSGGSVLFPQSAYNDRCVWNDGYIDKQRTFTTSGKWWITYYINGYALSADTLNLVVLPLTGTTRDTAICKGQLMILNAGNASSYLWSTGANTSSITIPDTGIYWVTRQVNQCITIDTFHVTRLIFPSLPELNDKLFCVGDSVFTGYNPVNGYGFTWYPSLQTTPGIFVSVPGKYILRIDSAACFFHDTLFVSRSENPVINLDPDTVVCFGDLKRIELDAGAFKTYLWQPTGETTRSVYPTQAMLYLLTVTDTNLCHTTQQILVDEECTSQLFFPNAFTPNNDGSNDVYEVRGTRQYAQEFSMQIYNRWGVHVFGTGNVYQYWDGTMNSIPQPADVYVLVANYRLGGKQHEVRMSVTLIR